MTSLESTGRHVPLPLYYQIKTRLQEAIETGQLQPGDRVPSERELTDLHGVSRMTARQALAQLEAMGLLVRVQGRGTFVAVPKVEQPLIGLTSFTEEMHQRGLEPGSIVLSLGEVAAGRRIAGILRLAEMDPVYRIERLRLAGGAPMALEVSHIPVQHCPGLLAQGLHQRSLYAVLAAEYSLHLTHASQSLEAILAGTYEAGLLHLPQGSPVLLLERVSRDRADRPLEFVQSYYRGDRYRFTAELVRREESPHDIRP